LAKRAILEVSEGQAEVALRAFLKQLLDNNVVEALLVPQVVEGGKNVAQGLVTAGDSLDRADPLAPVMPVNSARIVSAMTKKSPPSRKMAIVLRPCELRALVELVKLKQASLENIVTIGVDCFGTYSMNKYAEKAASSSSATQEFLNKASEGNGDADLRMVCQICEYPVPLTSDLTIGLVGLDANKGILVEANTPAGEEALEKLGLGGGDELAQKREAAVSRLLADRRKKAEEFLEQTRKEVSGLDKLVSIFSTCITCHNCRTACPICYCKECFFDSPTFEMEADKYLRQADKRGAIKMPTDTLLFHITRMNHMGVSCVGCGSCEEACPNDIPVAKLFRLVGADLQKLFEYVPGRSLDDELPLTTFREEELTQVVED